MLTSYFPPWLHRYNFAQLVKAQDDRDRKMKRLVDMIKAACDLLQDAAALKHHEGRMSVLARIARETLECSYFVSAWLKQTRFSKSSSRVVRAWLM